MYRRVYAWFTFTYYCGVTVSYWKVAKVKMDCTRECLAFPGHCCFGFADTCWVDPEWRLVGSARVGSGRVTWRCWDASGNVARCYGCISPILVGGPGELVRRDLQPTRDIISRFANKFFADNRYNGTDKQTHNKTGKHTLQSHATKIRQTQGNQL